MLAETYPPEFYADQSEGSRSSAAVIVPILRELINPHSVIDVGCGNGQWLIEWAHTGDMTVLCGVDGEHVPIRPEIAPLFRAHDLTQPLNVARREPFDLVTCFEVAEHIPSRYARTLVESLCKHGEVVAFSAAVPGQDGIGHINLHWPSYWARLFKAHGFRPYDVVRQRIWWDQRVEWWYRQNVILFATDAAAKRHSLGEPTAESGTTSSQFRALDLRHPALSLPEIQARLSATVCIPWRPSRKRIAPFQRVRAYWEQFGWPIITADSDTEIFSLAQARNNAVRQAETDVVVIADADTLLDPVNVLLAVQNPGGVCWPFTKYRIIDQEYLHLPLEELADAPWVNTWDGDGIRGVGGCLVATRKEFIRLGGQPPEFVGWGWEDTAFTAVVDTLSRVRRIEGYCFAFEHNHYPKRKKGDETYVGAQSDSPGWSRDVERNKELYLAYGTAQGRPWLMREVLKRRAADNPDDPLNWGQYSVNGSQATGQAHAGDQETGRR